MVMVVGGKCPTSHKKIGGNVRGGNVRKGGNVLHSAQYAPHPVRKMRDVLVCDFTTIYAHITI